MKRLFFVLLLALFFLPSFLQADEQNTPDTVQEDVPDTVHVGVYIISVHDIDFREKEYTIRFWLWMRYKNGELDFTRNVEVPNAKTIDKANNVLDTLVDTLPDGTIDTSYYMLMKVSCVMKEPWRVHNYPFDHQDLDIYIENAQFDTRSLVFVADTFGGHHDPELTVDGWNINNIRIGCSIHGYESNFGDVTLDKPHSEYASFNINIEIQRNAWGLFFKLFIGMYVAFLISYLSFFIHSGSMETRFGLGVGALFAAVGNKYIIDSILPESSAFTLVDALHATTFFSIFLVLASCSYSLFLFKQDKFEASRKMDRISARFIGVSYVVLNLVLVIRAIKGL